MCKITRDERSLIQMKLLHYKNDLIRQQKERRDKKLNKNVTEAAKNDDTPPKDGTIQPPRFPWEQKQQRQPRNKGKGRGKNNLVIT